MIGLTEWSIVQFRFTSPRCAGAAGGADTGVDGGVTVGRVDNIGEMGVGENITVTVGDGTKGVTEVVGWD